MNDVPRATQEFIRACFAAGATLRETATLACVSKGTVARLRLLLAAGYDIESERHEEPAINVWVERSVPKRLRYLRAEHARLARRDAKKAEFAERHIDAVRERLGGEILEGVSAELLALIAEQQADGYRVWSEPGTVPLLDHFDVGGVSRYSRPWDDPTADQALSE